MTSKNPLQMSLDILARRAYTERGLIEKLSVYLFPEEEIAECIQRLKQWGYLNDREYGTNRIIFLMAKLKSRVYIKNDLMKNGLMPEICDELLDIQYPEEIEINIAQKLLEKKFNKRPKTNSQGAFFLQRAGFSEDTIHHCFPNLTAP